MKYLILTLFCFYFQFISAQNTEDTKIFEVYSVEKLPEFPGGDVALINFISKNIIYPDSALKYGFQGKVFIQFIINEEGLIENIETIRSVNSYLDNEAIRVLKSMPKWKPGSVKGKNVKCRFMVPINFKLN